MPAPNVLLMHTDQQSAWTLSCYGDGLVPTPHIDRLASEGAQLDQFFTNSAVCTPSRGCMLTGRYPHCHGAYRNNIPLNRDEITFAHVLRDAGYETGYAGKWHLDGTPRPGWVNPERTMGFTHAPFMFNRGHWKKIYEPPGFQMEPMVFPYGEMGDEQTFTTDWLADKTIDFLRQDRDRPFLFMVSIPDPHTPFTVRPPYDTMFDPATMPLPASYDQKDLPDWAEAARSTVSCAPGAAELRRLKAQYCGEVKLIDDSVGRILEEVEQQGLLDETLVIFTTDHGEYMGEHGLMHKNRLYETAYRIPMVLRWPEAIPAGTRVDHIISTVDFQPTLLGLLDLAPSGREQGRDASALLRGESVPWDNVSHLHHSSLESAGIFTPEFELALCKDQQSVLFDRVNDPDQLHNLFDNPAYADVVSELIARVAAHHAEVDSPAAAWLLDSE